MTDTRIRELVSENSFVEHLTAELYTLIDAEIEKGDEMDCELVDELVNAIEALENAESEKKTALILPLLFNDNSALAKRIKNKVNGRNTLMRLTAIAAAVALLLSGTNQMLLSTEGTTLVKEFSALIDYIGEIFTQSKVVDETTTEENTTEVPSTEPSTEPTTENAEEENEPSPAVSIEYEKLELVTSEDFRTSYLWQEKLDLTGLQIFAVYTDGSQYEIDHDKCEISGFSSLKIGEQTVTVEYNGKTATFNVTVSRTEKNDTATRTITNIECNANGKDIIVPMGTENPAVSKNVKWRYVYSDGTFSPWTSCEDAKLVSDYDSKLLDTAQTLTYQAPNGMEFTVNVVVYDNTVAEEKAVTKLEIHKMPQAMKRYASNYNQYYTYVDSDCDFSEFQIKVYYDDRTNEIKTLADGEIKAFGTMSTERPSSYSGYTITFAYGDVTLAFKYDVIIKPEIQSYSINERIWQTYYVKDAPEEFPMTNVVTARMNDSNEDIYLDVEVKGYDPNKIGFVELELYYEGEYLCDYVGGYIYGDAGYAVTSRPITDGVANAPLNFRPYVIVAKCVGDGKFETYGDIKYELDDNPITDPTVNLESGVGEELKGMGITGLKCNCTDSATVYYTVSADEYITEFGTHEAKVYLYNVIAIDNGKYNLPTYQRNGIAEDLSYTITIKENPSYYRVDAPNNIKINIQDIYTEFYDKVHVYAVYKDGREEEIFDYDITRYLPSRPTTSARLQVYIDYPTGKNYTWKNVYVYSEGYEDSFFINLKDTRGEYDNYYSVGTKKPKIQIDFASAEQSQIYFMSTNDNLENVDIEGWDTSTPGEKEATIIYHSSIGDMKATYKYVVIPEYLNESCSVIFNDENHAYDKRYGLIDGTYKVIHTDKVGRTYEITDYTVTYPTNVTGYGIPTISYWHPHPLANADSSNPRPEEYKPIMKTAGACDNLQAVWLEDGNIKISLDCPYLPENGTMLFKFGYPAEKSKYGKIMKYIETSTPEAIISPDMLCPDMDNAYFYVYAYIVDDETGEEYGTYSGKISSFPLNK